MALAIVPDENSTGGKAAAPTIFPLHSPMFNARETEAIDSPLHVTFIILFAFFLTPLIICSNAMLLIAVRRYKRLHTPSNVFVVSLASSDLTVGILLPLLVYYELSKDAMLDSTLCVLPYCVIITVFSVSLLSMTAIALDKCTSLARPLYYNNLITHQTVSRYIAIFWMYSLIMASSPVLYVLFSTSTEKINCSFSLIQPSVRLFLFCLLYCPCAIIIAFCYGYIYIIARYHAQAIYSVEISLRQQNAFHPRYGRTLTLTVTCFFGLWLPFQVCMLSDAFSGTKILEGWSRFYLAFLVFTNSAANPWIYGFRSAELRMLFIRVFHEFLTKISIFPKTTVSAPSHATDHLDLQSFASNARLCPSPNLTTAQPLCNNALELEDSAFVETILTETNQTVDVS